MKVMIILLIGIPFCFTSSIVPDMHFLEVVAPDTPPRRITSTYLSATLIEITIIYSDRPPYKTNLANRRGYCSIEISDRHRDLLIYGREVNRD